MGTVPSCGTTSTPVTHTNPSDLNVAITVAQRMLAHYGDTSGYDVFAYAQAHGGLSEALRILLRALGAEPSGLPEKTSGQPLTGDEAVRRSVDAQFPLVAAFLNAEPATAAAQSCPVCGRAFEDCTCAGIQQGGGR